MNPNHELPDLSLPAPQVQQVPHEHAPAPVSPEATLAAKKMPTLAPPPQAMPLPAQRAPAAPVNPQAATQTALPALADDSDLIEKEWVEKAKAIVAGTRDDPFIQNREVNRFKAEYIKKRYNKDIKVPEA